VTLTCDPSYGFVGDVEQVCSDGDIANSKNGTGSVDAPLDEIGMPSVYSSMARSTSWV